jgi:hypothetical protein
MLVCPKFHFWPFKLAHMDLISSLCLLCTYTHSNIKVVSPMWCIEQLIAKIGRNGPMAHFPFNLPMPTTIEAHIEPPLHDVSTSSGVLRDDQAHI